MTISSALFGITRGEISVAEARAALGKRCVARTEKRLQEASRQYRAGLAGEIWTLEPSGERHPISGLKLLRYKKFKSRRDEVRAYKKFVAEQSVAATL